MMVVAHKRGFSMLTAIAVIVLMAVIAMYVTTTAGQSVKVTTDQYRKEQAIFYAKSYTEYAIMAISADAARMNGTNCLQTINGNILVGGETLTANRGRGRGYRIRVQIFYIGNASSGVGSCPVNRQLSTSVNQGAAQNEDQTPLTVIIDTYVDYNDLNDDRVDDSEIRHFTYHRRSVQKI